MDQKELMERLKQDPSALQSILQSKDGQQLMQLLSGTDGGAALNQAATQASSGNVSSMIQLIRNVMRDPNGAALVQRIHNDLQK